MGYNNSSSGPDRLIGQEWIEHGYQTSPLSLEAEDCPICGARNTTCTDATHRMGMAAQQSEDDD